MIYELIQQMVDDKMYWFIKEDGKYIAGFNHLEDAEYLLKYYQANVEKNIS
jgi:hypothetical protein